MSTGVWGESTVREIELPSARVSKRVALPRSVFGEGLTVFKNRLYQLTYTNRLVYVWDKELHKLETLHVPNSGPMEGWGLTHDGETLIASDGSSTLYHMDERFKPVGRVTVTDTTGHAVRGLNELEYVDGEIWANIYGTDCIARIDAHSGRIGGWIVASDLYPENPDPAVWVMNGIAYDGNRILLTGKNWPKIFEVTVQPSPELSFESSCRKHPMTPTSMSHTAELLSKNPSL